MAISSVLGSSALLPAGLGFRNVIINGGMDVWQRGTTAAIPSSPSTSYLADRWSGYRGTTGSTQSRVTSGLDGFQYALRLQRDVSTSAVNIIYVNQSFETSVMTKLANKQVTFSFYARAGANYSPSGSILYSRVVAGTGVEANIIYTGVTGGTEPVQGTSTLTTSWQRFTYTGIIPSGSTAGGVYFYFIPSGTAGAADYFEITGVQLEQNYQPTPFEQRPFGVEDFLCKRYYQKWGNSSNTSFMTIGSSIYSTPMTLASPMRAVNNTSVTYVAAIYGNGTSYTLNSLGISIFDSANPQYFRLEGSFSGSWNYSWPLCTFNTHNVIINSEL